MENKLNAVLDLGIELEKAKHKGVAAKELAVILGVHYDKATLAGLCNQLVIYIKKSQYEQRNKV